VTDPRALWPALVLVLLLVATALRFPPSRAEVLYFGPAAGEASFPDASQASQ